MKRVLSALRLLALLTLLTGAAYPGLMLLMGKGLFPGQTGGSLILKNGTVAGSDLVGQKFSSPRYFWPRPSATDYATLLSGASNLSPASKALSANMADRQTVWAGYADDREMLFTSGSGLDPDISPGSALAQIPRISKARGLEPSSLEALVKELTQKRGLGFLGQERVNVLRLNLALDDLTGKEPHD